MSFSVFLHSCDQRRDEARLGESNSCAYVDKPPPQEGTQVLILQVLYKLSCKELIRESRRWQGCGEVCSTHPRSPSLQKIAVIVAMLSSTFLLGISATFSYLVYLFLFLLFCSFFFFTQIALCLFNTELKSRTEHAENYVVGHV